MERQYVWLSGFSTETFDYSLLVQENFTSTISWNPTRSANFDVKGKLDITKQDGSHLTVPLAELESCIRGGCHVCTDLTAVNADISAGAMRSAAGYTTLVIRTPTGRGFVEHAVQAHAPTCSWT